MAIAAIAGAATAPLATTPTLPATGQIGWTGGPAIGQPGSIPPGDTVSAAGASGASGPQSFGQTLTKALDGLQGSQAKADNLAVSAATGDLTNVHDYMIAATEASLATELTVAVRNKAVEAFNQIMNMGV
jgi:flagellar hook-basal body complex protein FliE